MRRSPASGQRGSLARTLRDVGGRFIVPSGEEITRLLLAPEPLNELAKIISAQIKITRVSIYQDGGGVNRAAAFFGRESELSKILDRDPANYFLIGGRQVGKSSLLKEIHRRCEARQTIQSHYLVLSDEDIEGPLAAALGAPERSMDAHLADLSSGTGPPRLILVDEADSFVRADAERGYSTLRRFRALSEEGKAFFILTGFWSLYRSVYFDYTSAIRNFGEPIVIAELDRDASQSLITKPMGALNVRFESDSLVQRICDVSGRRANIMVRICHVLIQSLPPEVRIIDEATVEQAIRSPHVTGAVRSWQELSGRDAVQANTIDRLLVYLIVANAGATIGELEQHLEAAGATVTTEDLRESLTRLDIGFVIARSDDDGYRIRVPLLLDQLRETSPERAIASNAA
ncbi:MAG: hypothetical protein AAGI03_10845 [Pseudomonadota bacterium]